MDWVGIAAVIVALGTAIAAVITSLRLNRKAADIHSMVQAIDHAVNGKAPGEATLVSQVDDLHKEIPVPITKEVNGAALLPLVKLLVADMQERQNKGKHGGL